MTRNTAVRLVNIGSEITSLMIFGRGAVQHTAVFPFGGLHFTKDIAVGLRVSIQEANKIKHQYGCVASFLMDDEERQEIHRDNAGRADRNARTFKRDTVRHHAAACDRAAAAYRPRDGKRAGADLERRDFDRRRFERAGMVEIAEQVFDAPTRLGYLESEYFGGLAEQVHGPEWAVGCGLALSSMRSQVRDYSRNGKSPRSRLPRGSKIFATNLDNYNLSAGFLPQRVVCFACRQHNILLDQYLAFQGIASSQTLQKS